MKNQAILKYIDKTLNGFFRPSSIAIIGASDNPESVGYWILKNSLCNGYKGKVFPVNIKRESVQGVKAYNTILNIKENIDLAVIATPAETVLNLVKECSKKNVKSIIILSAGFIEVGEKGKEMYEEIKKIALENNIRVIGPNCLGVINNELGINLTFSLSSPKKGNIGFVSQSGALGSAILDWSISNNVGISFFASIGSMMDVGFDDLIEYAYSDKNTDCLVIYMESLAHSQKFLEYAKKFSLKKPIVLLKSGRSLLGSKAAMSHTGKLAGDDDTFNAAFESAGIIRVDEIEELFDLVKLFSIKKEISGNRLCIVTNAGGPGVIATDSLIKNKGELYQLSENTITKFNSFLPSHWSRNNPIDVLGDADPERYEKTLQILIKEKNIDGILVILTPQSMTDIDAIAKTIINAGKNYNKPLLASFIGGKSVENSKSLFNDSNVLFAESPERCVKAFLNQYRYKISVDNLNKNKNFVKYKAGFKKEETRKIIEDSLKEKKYILDSIACKEILKNYLVPLPKYCLATSLEEVIKNCDKIGYPLVMKIVSRDIVHKTEAGGVIVNIDSKEKVSASYKQIMSSVKKYSPNAKIDGVILEKMVNQKHEVLIGSKKDSIFGQVIVFGSGGVYVELFKDVKFSLVPIDMDRSLELIKKTKIYDILSGYRGSKVSDIKCLQETLCKVSCLLEDCPEIKELDINPFKIDENSGFAVDCRIVLEEKN